MVEGKTVSNYHRQETLGRSGLSSSGERDVLPLPQQLPNQPLPEPKNCPQCGSSRLYRDGFRTLNDGSSVQRWLCRTCGYRFSEPNVKVHIASKVSETLDPIDNRHKGRVVSSSRTIEKSANGFSFPLSEDIRSHNLSSVAKGLNRLPLYSSNAECAPKKAKNLRTATETETVVGTSPKTLQDVKGKLLEFAFWMQIQGYKEPTIQTRMSRLETLVRRGANLFDPESIKKAIALQRTWCDGTKANVVDAYTCFLEKEGLTWKPPATQDLKRSRSYQAKAN